MRRLIVVLAGPALLLLCDGRALAQFGPGGGFGRPGGQPGGGGGLGQGQGAPPPDKPEGPAEQAPEKAATDVANEALPAWPGQKEKTLQFFQLNGYLRGRGFFWNNFHLGTFNDPSQRANPFTPPYTELPIPVSGTDPLGNAFNCKARTGDPTCHSNSIKTADMRFRLEPTLNLSQHVRIRTQIDIFDNLVLGSTPDGFYINGRDPTPNATPAILSRGQVPPESGINALKSSITAKRAWGEVNTPLFEVAFGRMPLHWGTGMLFHDGNCLDCDFGVTVDRVQATGRLWGHYLTLSWDWAATGPTSDIIYPQQLLGWNYVADNVADVNQWTMALGRKEDEGVIADKLRRNETVFNYGAFLMLRTQDWALNYNPRPQTTPTTAAAGSVNNLYPATEVLKSLGKRSAWSLTPDIYARLDWGKLHLEVEGAGVFGNIGELDVPNPITNGTPLRATVSLQQLGGLIRGHYKLLHDSLKIAGEIGSASGAQNGDPTGQLNWRTAQDAPNGFTDQSTGFRQLRNSRFAFDPDYHVDMILFRRILGTVYNATYIKPTVTYWLIDNFGGEAAAIYSLANKPATFPGHAINMGMELNARLMYRNEEEGFYVTLEYGVLFNLGALEQHGATVDDPWYPQPYPVGSTTAQAFQAKIMLKF